MHYLIFIFLGLLASAHVVVINIADYPVPELVGRLWAVLAAGPIGAVIAGALLQKAALGSDPMPMLTITFAVIGGGLGAAAGTALAAGFAKKTHLSR